MAEKFFKREYEDIDIRRLEDLFFDSLHQKEGPMGRINSGPFRSFDNLHSSPEFCNDLEIVDIIEDTLEGTKLDIHEEIMNLTFKGELQFNIQRRGPQGFDTNRLKEDADEVYVNFWFPCEIEENLDDENRRQVQRKERAWKRYQTQREDILFDLAESMNLEVDIQDPGFGLDFCVRMPNEKEIVLDFLKNAYELLKTPEVVKEGKMSDFLFEDLRSRGYENIRLAKEGGLRNIVRAEREGSEYVIKVDKRNIEDERVRRIAQKYNTSNELEIVKRIKDPGAHNLVRVVDWIRLKKFGEEGVATIEEHFESKSLEELCKGDNRLNLESKDYRQITEGIMNALTYLHNEAKILHRDVKPSNVLIGKKIEKQFYQIKEEEVLEARLCDFGNSVTIEEQEKKWDPTYGGHLTTDPSIVSWLTGEEAIYGEQQEVYATGMTLYFSIMGKYFHKIKDGKAVYLDDGSSMMTNGKFDREKYELKLDEAMKEMKEEEKRRKLPSYHKAVKRCLTLEDGPEDKEEIFMNSIAGVRGKGRFYNISDLKRGIDDIYFQSSKISLEDLKDPFKENDPYISSHE